MKENKFNNPHFFGESKWTDVEPNNASWLVSNGAYHSGRTYVDYYKWLTDIKSGNKTVDGVSVKSVDDEYTDYDWVVNTADETFRLPLLNGEEDLSRNTCEAITIKPSGNSYIAPKNGAYSFVVGCTTTTASAGVLLQNTTADSWEGDQIEGVAGYKVFSANIKAKKGDAVALSYYNLGTINSQKFHFIPDVGNGSLYFYVGDVLQDPALINAGEVLDYFSKLNTVHCVVETFKSGSSWYRVYDDGWVEQGGLVYYVDGTGFRTVTFLKPFNMSGNPNIQITMVGSYYNAGPALQHLCNAQTRSDTGFTTYVNSNIPVKYWQACGYGA